MKSNRCLLKNSCNHYIQETSKWDLLLGHHWGNFVLNCLKLALRLYLDSAASRKMSFCVYYRKNFLHFICNFTIKPSSQLRTFDFCHPSFKNSQMFKKLLGHFWKLLWYLDLKKNRESCNSPQIRSARTYLNICHQIIQRSISVFCLPSRPFPQVQEVRYNLQIGLDANIIWYP